MGDPLNLSEVYNAITVMTNNRAIGPDGIPAGGAKLHYHIHSPSRRSRTKREYYQTSEMLLSTTGKITALIPFNSSPYQRRSSLNLIVVSVLSVVPLI